MSTPLSKREVRVGRRLGKAWPLGLIPALCAAGLMLAPAARAQAPGTIVTVAGTGHPNFGGDGGPAKYATFYEPLAVAVDAKGNLYVADADGHIRKVDAGGMISTLAGVGTDTYANDGTPTGGFAGDGGPATAAQFNNPSGIAVDAAGDVFIADTFNDRVRKVSPDGTISTVAGGGKPADGTGDGGPAVQAALKHPYGLAVDAKGDLFIADDGNNLIREMTPDGMITSVAGTGDPGFMGDGGAATDARLSAPKGVAVAADGSLFIADTGNSRVRKVAPGGMITTVAGGGASGSAVPAIMETLGAPRGVTLDGSGNLFVADDSSGRVWEVKPDGSITTAAIQGFSLSGLPLPGAAPISGSPTSVAADRKGDLFVTSAHDVCLVHLDGTSSVLAGGSGGAGGIATAASLAFPGSLVSDSAGGLIISDAHGLYSVGPDGVLHSTTGQVDLRSNGAALAPAFDGSGAVTLSDQGLYKVGLDGSVTPVQTGLNLFVITGLAVDGAGHAFYSIEGSGAVYALNPDGSQQVVAGMLNSIFSSAGDGGPAAKATFGSVGVRAVDRACSLYVADGGNFGGENPSVRRITSDGTISTVAAVAADSMAIDGAGNLFTTSRHLCAPQVLPPVIGNPPGAMGPTACPPDVVLMITPDGMVTTVAGGGNPADGLGDGGPATMAALSGPMGVAIDPAGNLYISDTGHYRVRKVIGVAVPAPMPGDVNGDGKVNIADATLALRISLGLFTPTYRQRAAADVDFNCKVNVRDATRIVRMALGLK